MVDESLSSLSLAGRTVLLACSANTSAALAAGIEAMGGRALHFPVIEVREVEDKQPLDKAIASLRQYEWIVLTSGYAVRFFVQRLKKLKITPAAEDMPRICAIGPATARKIRESGYTVELIPENFVAEGIVESLRKYHGGLEALRGRRILIPRAKEAREVLPEALAAAGVLVDAIPCYQTVCARPVQEILEQLRIKSPDLIAFTSSSAIRNFVGILGRAEGVETLMKSAVAVLGPIAGNTAESFGKSPDVLPNENTIESLLDAIRAYFVGRESSA